MCNQQRWGGSRIGVPCTRTVTRFEDALYYGRPRVETNKPTPDSFFRTTELILDADDCRG